MVLKRAQRLGPKAGRVDEERAWPTAFMSDPLPAEHLGF